ncbi:MAG: hypothetical protein NUW07_07035 [Candidatus Saccharicenans sp.]|nr:hypothetical protein [Candidatus Saccharicenans sp.]MDH7493784.1 hypothetical protein [Candidatus Saccharicenans sp.]
MASENKSSYIEMVNFLCCWLVTELSNWFCLWTLAGKAGQKGAEKIRLSSHFFAGRPASRLSRSQAAQGLWDEKN